MVDFILLGIVIIAGAFIALVFLGFTLAFLECTCWAAGHALREKPNHYECLRCRNWWYDKAPQPHLLARAVFSSPRFCERGKHIIGGGTSKEFLRRTNEKYAYGYMVSDICAKCHHSFNERFEWDELEIDG